MKPAGWAQFEAAIDAYSRGDYATALQKLRPWANQGDPFSQYQLGLMYAKGCGVQQDFQEALRWFRMAAEQGNADIQFSIASIYALERRHHKT